MRFLHLGWDGRGRSRAQLVDAFGTGVQHVMVSAEAGATINGGMSAACPADFPALNGAPTPGRLQRLARAMRGYDLILTYGWGAIDAVMAHTLFGELNGLAPLVHHEDGFGEGDVHARRRARIWYRRIAFGCVSMVIVSTRQLEAVARESWQQPVGKVRRIANGIDTAAYGRTPKPDALPRVIKRPGERWIGTLAELTPDANFSQLVSAFAVLPEEWQLVIVGDGPEREAIRDEALRRDLAHRVHLPGSVPDSANVIGLFDIFAVQPGNGRFQLSLTEAMAAGLPVVSAGMGDVAEMVAEENLPFVSAGADGDALASALLALAGDEVQRRRVGDANRRRARAEFDMKLMVASYRAAYAQVLGRQSFP